MLKCATMIVNTIEHQPFRANDDGAHVTLEGTGDDYDRIKLRLEATATTVTGRYTASNSADLVPAVTIGLAHNRGDVHDVAKTDIIPALDAAAARTARRILQLDAWIADHNPVRPDDIHTDVVGSYNPLRPDRGSLAVITESNEQKGDWVLPVIATIDDDDAVEDRVDAIVEGRAINQMSSMQKTHYRDDDDRSIEATEYTTCESLEEAQRVLTGRHHPGDSDDDGSTGHDADQGRGQASLTSF